MILLFTVKTDWSTLWELARTINSCRSGTFGLSSSDVTSVLLLATDAVVGVAEAVALREEGLALLRRGALRSEGARAAPLTSATLAQAVAVAEEVVAIVTRDLLVTVDVTKHLHARRVASGRNELQEKTTGLY